MAYYTLLSMIPLLILMLIALSNFIDEAPAVRGAVRVPAVRRSRPRPMPSSASCAHFFAIADEVGGALLVDDDLLFSALAFTVLENAMSVIFIHRVAVRRRRFHRVGAAAVSVHSLSRRSAWSWSPSSRASSRVLATRDITVFGVPRSLDGSVRLSAVSARRHRRNPDAHGDLSGDAGRPPFVPARADRRHRAPGLLWEITRHVLVWYYGTISQVRARLRIAWRPAITVMLSVEIAAIVLLLGAQVIAEYERCAGQSRDSAPRPHEASARRVRGQSAVAHQRRIVESRRLSPSGSPSSGVPTPDRSAYRRGGVPVRPPRR